MREKGIEYVSVSLMDMRHKLFIPSLENEQCLVELVKKVSFAPQVLCIKFMHFGADFLNTNLHKPFVDKFNSMGSIFVMATNFVVLFH